MYPTIPFPILPNTKFHYDYLRGTLLVFCLLYCTNHHYRKTTSRKIDAGRKAALSPTTTKILVREGKERPPSFEKCFQRKNTFEKLYNSTTTIIIMTKTQSIVGRMNLNESTNQSINQSINQYCWMK